MEAQKKELDDKVKQPEHTFVDYESTFDESVRRKNIWIDCFFLYSLIWSFGSVMTEQARKYFNTWLHQQIELKNQQRYEAQLASDEVEIEKILEAQALEQRQQNEHEDKGPRDRSKDRVNEVDDADNESLESLILYKPTGDFTVGSIHQMEASLPETNVFDIFFDVSEGCFKNWRGVYNQVLDERRGDKQKRSLVSMTIYTQDYLKLEYLIDRQLAI